MAKINQVIIFSGIMIWSILGVADEPRHLCFTNLGCPNEALVTCVSEVRFDRYPGGTFYVDLTRTISVSLPPTNNLDAVNQACKYAIRSAAHAECRNNLEYGSISYSGDVLSDTYYWFVGNVRRISNWDMDAGRIYGSCRLRPGQNINGAQIGDLTNTVSPSQDQNSAIFPER